MIQCTDRRVAATRKGDIIARIADGGDTMRRPVLRNLFLASSLVALTQLMTPTDADAEARLALVIGQSAYRTVPELPNAANDAKGMAELLGNAGFTVTTAANLAQNEMRADDLGFRRQGQRQRRRTVALVFYAGHGLQIDGENYLVPVDLDPKREADIPLQGVRLNDLLNTLGALPTRARIFMLDACRNNPFPALSGAGHGLAIVDTKAGAPGSFISYSTSPGAEAEDGSGVDSPYTTAALTVAKQPNVPIEEVFKRIRVAVAQSTDGRQIPWESSSLTTDFKFFGGEQRGSPLSGRISMALASGTRSVEDWRKDLQGKDAKAAYELVIADDTVPAYQAYVECTRRRLHAAPAHDPGASAPDAGLGARDRDQHPRFVRGLSGELGQQRPRRDRAPAAAPRAEPQLCLAGRGRSGPARSPSQWPRPARARRRRHRQRRSIRRWRPSSRSASTTRRQSERWSRRRRSRAGRRPTKWSTSARRHLARHLKP